MNNFYSKILFSFLFLLISFDTRPQSYSVNDIVKIWGMDEKANFKQYNQLNIYFRDSFPVEAYASYIDSMEKRITPFSNAKLRLHFGLNKIQLQWRCEKYNTYKQLAEKTFQLQKLALECKNSFLAAYYYYFQGDLFFRSNEMEKAVFYLLKASTLQEEYGLQYFDNGNEVFFGLARALYNLKDFNLCKTYILKSLYEKIDTVNVALNYHDKQMIIFKSNLLAAVYKETQQFDSALYYHQVINFYLKSNPFNNTDRDNLWKALNHADISEIYLLQKKNILVLPSLQTGIDTCLKAGNYENASRFSDDMATYYTQQQNYNAALPPARQSYNYALQAQKPEYIMNASFALMNIFYQLKKLDSSLFYTKIYFSNKEKFELTKERSKYSTMQAKVEYEIMQQNFYLKEAAIREYKHTRNGLIALSILILGIGLYARNNYKIKNERKLKILTLENELKEKEIKDAMQQVELFKKNIIEKEKLIALFTPSDSGVNNAAIISSNITILTPGDWINFRRKFNTAYPHFFPALARKMPGLTPAMERLCSLIYLRLNNGQIAQSLGIGKESVARSIRRLREYLNVSSNTNLEDYLQNLQL